MSTEQGNHKPVEPDVIDLDWPYIIFPSDSDLSMLGEARHKTIGGRGIVGRLIHNHATKHTIRYQTRKTKRP